ncbi:MAG: hypothetical protein ACYDCJ_10975 [Gammaproteobacteria bacterium]
MKTQHRVLWIAILWGGIVAGTIDIGAAALINGLSPVIILHAIASGLLGKASFNEGAPAAILGLGLQWGMSLIIAGLFVAATRRLPVLTRRWIASGSGYGVVIFLVMNYVVVPLSAAPWNPWKRQFSVEKFIENFLAMILFGLIVALCARHLTYRNAASHRENTPVSPA